jgi:hypothetical protein
MTKPLPPSRPIGVDRIARGGADENARHALAVAFGITTEVLEEAASSSDLGEPARVEHPQRMVACLQTDRVLAIAIASCSQPRTVGEDEAASASVCAKGTTVKGVDVSAEVVDWQAWLRCGRIRFDEMPG